MKKYIIYIVILLIGLVLGSFLFGNSATDKATHDHEKEGNNQQWTCSMHPQIMQAEPGSCPICGMDLIPAETSAEGLATDQFKLTKNAMALANIQTTVIGNGAIKNSGTKLSGKIVENENNMAVQTAHFAGRIEKLYLNAVGDKINRGQLLARIYSPELYAAQQELLTAAALKESQPNLYKAVRGKLKLWKLSEKQINSIEASKKPIPNFPVYANVSGIVTERLVEEGNHVMEGDPLFKIANLSTVWANFDVYENQISLFKKGQEILITTNAYSNKEFKSKVSFIDPILNVNTRTVKLRAVLHNRDKLFKPGMFVEGTIKSKTIDEKQALVIPSTAILWTGKRSVVYLKTNLNEPIFEMREITLGNQLGDAYEVLEGLNAGDEVVTNGAFTVDAAAQLQGKKSMMNKSGGKTTTGHEGHLGIQTDSNDNTKEDTMVMVDKSTINKEFKKQLGKVVASYILLKNALVEDNTNMAQKKAQQVKKSIEKVEMSLLKGDAHTSWMKLLKHINKNLSKVQNAQEIKSQRAAFLVLGKQLSDAIETFGIQTEKEQALYLEFCPMADNNNGGYWLSYDKEIKNPFFGKAMLTCGEVKATY